MCLWLPYFAHHNTIVVEKEEQLRPFRSVKVPRRLVVLAPYMPHHNTVVISSRPADPEYTEEGMDRQYIDEKQHMIRQLENGNVKTLLGEREAQLKAFKDDLLRKGMGLVKAE